MSRILAFLLLCVTLAASQSAAGGQAFVDREQRLLHDEEQQNVKAVRAAVAPDAVLIDANGAVYTTEMLLRSVAAAAPRTRTPENKSAHPLGADAWIVSFEFQLPPAAPSGRPHRFRVSSIWKMQDGVWKLAWRQATPIVP